MGSSLSSRSPMAIPSSRWSWTRSRVANHRRSRAADYQAQEYLAMVALEGSQLWPRSRATNTRTRTWSRSCCRLGSPRWTQQMHP
uniref:Predicted protein n=1 Tax=Hordeum vulgare subsp. vulgare TaxID=112509 RepID=F2DAY1_HORVV|nr:predicted protein [Hordeum vulgare subsp. vulgare]